MKILVIDDDEITLKMFKNALELNGYNCKSCSSSKDGIKEYESSAYDVIFTDYGLPDMNGIELIKIIRKFDSSAFIVLCTGNIEKEIISKAFSCGANDYFEKPVSWKRVNDLLCDIKEKFQVVAV